ncbi:Protein-glucosylgalactosylhydroxylysine glucosidase [Eumeta japonica]|uniref:Protein-glucosylgalactosylhydroxylysine glucosidase n=1 Tax=Eumeta variegata TaxID=151549 RepID=A0A4C1Z5V1_EUMVA|nr:Protein-glucosylgalactosylhydroxylysine glucosidase [Eumeta japonica]
MSMDVIIKIVVYQNQKSDQRYSNDYVDGSHCQDSCRLGIWSELKRPESGAVNFLTGAGGLLQAVMFGYAGLSIHLDRLTILRPRPPPHATSLTIRGLKYLGANLTLDVHSDRATLSVASVSEEWPLVLNIGNYNVTLRPGITVSLAGDGPFTLASAPWKDCPLPADVIGQNYLRPIGA